MVWLFASPFGTEYHSNHECIGLTFGEVLLDDEVIQRALKPCPICRPRSPIHILTNAELHAEQRYENALHEIGYPLARRITKYCEGLLDEEKSLKRELRDAFRKCRTKQDFEVLNARIDTLGALQ